jgi:hypothetical protein
MKSRPNGPVRWKISRQNQPTLRISEPMPYRKRSSSVLRALDKHLESSSSSLSNSSTPAKRTDLVNGFLRGSSWQAFFCITKMKVSRCTAARPREPTLARPKKAGTIRCGNATPSREPCVAGTGCRPASSLWRVIAPREEAGCRGTSSVLTQPRCRISAPARRRPGLNLDRVVATPNAERRPSDCGISSCQSPMSYCA